MAVRAGVTCADCYFRQEGLCALKCQDPCPTFRAYARGALTPSKQPRLVPRSLAYVAQQHAAA